MNKFLAVAAAASVLLGAPALAQTVNTFGPLLTPAELEAQIDTVDPLILDIRTGEHAPEYIPGAVAAPYGLFRGPVDNPGQLPDQLALTSALQELGVTQDRPTVIVHQGADETDFGAAARVYWTLKSNGVSQLAIINGGMNAWKGAGLEIATDPEVPTPSDVTFTFDPTWLATTEDVKAVVDGGKTATLIDARPQEFWEGKQSHPAAERPGTLPQSEFFTHSRWFSDDPTLINPTAAKALASENGYENGDALISFCNTGHWAATNWFALSELAGIEGVKLYPESMVGWSKTGYPMDNVPGLLKNLMNKVKDAF